MNRNGAQKSSTLQIDITIRGRASDVKSVISEALAGRRCKWVMVRAILSLLWKAGP
jgi:hypothetical protein